MSYWTTTPEEEIQAIRIAAARAGCRVESLGIKNTAHGPRAVGHVICPDGWGAARMLLAAAIEDSRTAGARDLALQLRRTAASDADYARVVHRFVQDHVKFVRESGEVFTGPAYTLEAGAGDCDDQARLLIALALAGGIDARLGILHRGDDAPPEEQGPAHAVGVLCVDGVCSWAETTIAAGFGEHPLKAADRLGLLKRRTDIAQEQVIMSEKDLGPIPADYVAKNPPDRVALDTDALIKLGLLAALPSDPGDPTNVDFRTAVLALQLAAGIPADALIGPKSRAAIASRLPDGEHFTNEYRTSIGDIGAVAGGAGDLSDAFFASVAQMARDFQAKGAKVQGLDFLACWMGESGVNPHRAGNPPYNAETGPNSFGGLNMMSEQARQGARFPGTTLREWISLSDVEQLVYVRRYYEGRNVAKLTSATAIELMNFLPAFIDHADDPSFVLTKKGDGTGWYEANTFAFDPGGKGFIAVADLTAYVLRATSGDKTGRWNAIAARMAAAGDAPAPGIGVAGVVGVVALVGAVGGALADMLGKL